MREAAQALRPQPLVQQKEHSAASSVFHGCRLQGEVPRISLFAFHEPNQRFHRRSPRCAGSAGVAVARRVADQVAAAQHPPFAAAVAAVAVAAAVATASMRPAVSSQAPKQAAGTRPAAAWPLEAMRRALPPLPCPEYFAEFFGSEKPSASGPAGSSWPTDQRARSSGASTR
jgi:hypothetical protein